MHEYSEKQLKDILEYFWLYYTREKKIQNKVILYWKNQQFAIQQNSKWNLRVIGNDTVTRQM